MQKRIYLGFIMSLGFILVACSGNEPSFTSSQQAVDAIALNVTAITSSSISLSWTLPSGGSSSSVYVYKSLANPANGSFSSLDNVLQNGTLVDQGTGLTSATISSGIIGGNTYLFNVVVTDGAGNSTIYTPVGDYFNGTLVLYYPFNGNANDISVSKNNGILQSAPALTTDRFGVSNRAYSFVHSSAQFIHSTSNIPITGAASRTMSFWIKAGSVPPSSTQIPIAFGTGNGGSRTSYGVFIDTSAIYHIWGYGAADFVTTTTATTAWEHWVTTYDGTTYSAYKNGVLQVAQADVLTTGSGLLAVGDAPTTVPTDDTSYFTGSMDDIRIYSSALSAADVLNLYNATRP